MEGKLFIIYILLIIILLGTCEMQRNQKEILGEVRNIEFKVEQCNKE